MSSSKKLNFDFAAGVYLSEAQNPEPQTPPPYTLYTCTVYDILIPTGKGGGRELNQREGKRGISSQSWIENSNMTDCISSL